jgi:hypothetical protein
VEPLENKYLLLGRKTDRAGQQDAGKNLIEVIE